MRAVGNEPSTSARDDEEGRSPVHAGRNARAGDAGDRSMRRRDLALAGSLRRRAWRDRSPAVTCANDRRLRAIVSGDRRTPTQVGAVRARRQAERRQRDRRQHGAALDVSPIQPVVNGSSDSREQQVQVGPRARRRRPSRRAGTCGGGCSSRCRRRRSSARSSGTPAAPAPAPARSGPCGTFISSTRHRDDDGDDAVAERFEAVRFHVGSSAGASRPAAAMRA